MMKILISSTSGKCSREWAHCVDAVLCGNTRAQTTLCCIVFPFFVKVFFHLPKRVVFSLTGAVVGLGDCLEALGFA